VKTLASRAGQRAQAIGQPVVPPASLAGHAREIARQHEERRHAERMDERKPDPHRRIGDETGNPGERIIVAVVATWKGMPSNNSTARAASRW
jgi:hypothetical protein